MPQPVEVVAAVVERGGRFLITRRRPGTHLAGLWEFPGGKTAPGESGPDALARELREELGVRVSAADLVETIEWRYPGQEVRIHFYRCALDGEPAALEGQELAWVAPADLGRYEFPAADAAIVARLAAS
jgi:8-oxo-dGTP diphosphatase